jgi:hypothetical protein
MRKKKKHERKKMRKNIIVAIIVKEPSQPNNLSCSRTLMKSHHSYLFDKN